MPLGEICADIFESALFVIFLDRFNDRKFTGGRALACSFMCFVLLLTNIILSDRVAIFSYLPVILDFIITIVYTRICLQGTFWEQDASIVLYYVGIMGTAVAVIWYMAFAQKAGILLWMDTESSERMLMVAVSKGLLLLYVIFMLRQKRRFQIRHSGEAFLVFFFAPFMVLAIVVVLLKFLFELYYQDERGRLIAGIMAGIIVLLAVILYFYQAMMKKENAEREKENAFAMVWEQKLSYQNLLEQQARIRTIEHDMKNRLLGIRHYFVSGDVDGGVKKIDDILEAYKAAHQNSEGGKYPWEAVIRSKLAYAEKSGIAVEGRVEEGDYDALDDIDLCIILGNLLDNAIEAQERTADKRIGLFVSEDKGVVYIRIQNNIEDPKRVRQWQTGKKNHMEHGIGIRSVKEIVKTGTGQVCGRRYRNPIPGSRIGGKEDLSSCGKKRCGQIHSVKNTGEILLRLRRRHSGQRGARA